MPRVRVIKASKVLPKKKVDEDKYEYVKGIKMRKDRLTNYVTVNFKNEKINE